MTWFNKHETISSKTSFLYYFKAVHDAMRNNDYNTYISLGSNLKDEFNKLTTAEVGSFRSFAMTLTKPEPLELSDMTEPPGGKCSVTCLNGSCTIECPQGTKPKCFCDQLYNPQCGCEPYDR